MTFLCSVIRNNLQGNGSWAYSGIARERARRAQARTPLLPEAAGTWGRLVEHVEHDCTYQNPRNHGSTACMRSWRLDTIRSRTPPLTQEPREADASAISSRQKLLRSVCYTSLAWIPNALLFGRLLKGPMTRICLSSLKECKDLIPRRHPKWQP